MPLNAPGEANDLGQPQLIGLDGRPLDGRLGVVNGSESASVFLGNDEDSKLAMLAHIAEKARDGTITERDVQSWGGDRRALLAILGGVLGMKGLHSAMQRGPEADIQVSRRNAIKLVGAGGLLGGIALTMGDTAEAADTLTDKKPPPSPEKDLKVATTGKKLPSPKGPDGRPRQRTAEEILSAEAAGEAITLEELLLLPSIESARAARLFVEHREIAEQNQEIRRQNIQRQRRGEALLPERESPIVPIITARGSTVPRSAASHWLFRYRQQERVQGQMATRYYGLAQNPTLQTRPSGIIWTGYLGTDADRARRAVEDNVGRI